MTYEQADIVALGTTIGSILIITGIAFIFGIKGLGIALVFGGVFFVLVAIAVLLDSRRNHD